MAFHNQSAMPQKAVDSLKTIFLTKVIFLSFLIAVSAQISIPFWPVPLTLQPMAILAIGLMFQPKLAISAVIAYIIEGACGFPVFQGLAGGAHHLFGPTGGYIIGFASAAAIVSYFKGSQPTFVHLFKICLLAKASLFTLGVLWLSSFVGTKAAFSLGLFPFLLKVPVDIAFSIISYNLFQSFKQRFGLNSNN